MRDGSPVLGHPLYLKYNGLSAKQIAQLADNNGWKIVIIEMEAIMLTNENMPILWYMRSLLDIGKELGFVG